MKRKSEIRNEKSEIGRAAGWPILVLIFLMAGMAWGQPGSWSKYDVSEWKPVFAVADSVIAAGDSLIGTAIRIDHIGGAPPQYLTMEIRLGSSGTPGLWGYLELSRDSLNWGPMLSVAGDTLWILPEPAARAVAGTFWVAADALGGKFVRARFYNSGGDKLTVTAWLEMKPR